MGGTCSTFWGVTWEAFGWISRREDTNLEDLGVDGRTILRCEISGSHGGKYKVDSFLGC
jgi:hypothetical protein